MRWVTYSYLKLGYFSLQTKLFRRRANFLQTPMTRMYFFYNNDKSCLLKLVDVSLYRATIPMQPFRYFSDRARHLYNGTKKS